MHSIVPGTLQRVRLKSAVSVGLPRYQPPAVNCRRQLGEGGKATLIQVYFVAAYMPAGTEPEATSLTAPSSLGSWAVANSRAQPGEMDAKGVQLSAGSLQRVEISRLTGTISGTALKVHGLEAVGSGGPPVHLDADDGWTQAGRWGADLSFQSESYLHDDRGGPRLQRVGGDWRQSSEFGLSKYAPRPSCLDGGVPLVGLRRPFLPSRAQLQSASTRTSQRRALDTPRLSPHNHPGCTKSLWTAGSRLAGGWTRRSWSNRGSQEDTCPLSLSPRTSVSRTEMWGL